MKKNITLILLPLVLGALVSCASNRPAKSTARVAEQARMFWQIDGVDADGKHSVVYIQGTIHVGDKRLYPLANPVVEAWNSADRIVGEISTADWAKFQNELQNRIRESVRRSRANGSLRTVGDKPFAAIPRLYEFRPFRRTGTRRSIYAFILSTKQRDGRSRRFGNAV